MVLTAGPRWRTRVAVVETNAFPQYGRPRYSPGMWGEKNRVFISLSVEFMDDADLA